jgi:BirA family biotin operon repressor/biotin-[acetyl-CoA-carboxylase] ligase
VARRAAACSNAAMSSPFLDADRLMRETCLADVRLFPSLRSTNDYAHTAAAESIPLPLLIAAEDQTAGRGRGANRWLTGSGALTFSLLMAPDPVRVPPSRWPLLSLTIGSAVCRSVESLIGRHHDVRLKWPNDVYLNGRKVCGILVESPAASPGRLIVGIGINVNNRLTDAAVEIQQRMTSLADAAEHDLDRTDVLLAVVKQIALSLELLGDDPLQLIQQCRLQCYLTGRFLSLNDGVREISGTCLGIDDDGALRLETAAGEQRCVAGVVTILN